MPREQPILIVDGDSAMRATLREQLTCDNAFSVVEAASLREAEILLNADPRSPVGLFTAVIIDAVLPDGDGHAFCARLRALGLTMPVILLNGSNGYRAADNTITIAKPFRLSELMARLRAQIVTPVVSEAESSLRIGPFEFSPAARTLRHTTADHRIRLTEKEAAILVFLHGTSARAVSRMELLREVWGYHPTVTTHTLETHIYRLRRKIETDPAGAPLLITEAGGYRLSLGH